MLVVPQSVLKISKATEKFVSGTPKTKRNDKCSSEGLPAVHRVTLERALARVRHSVPLELVRPHEGSPTVSHVAHVLTLASAGGRGGEARWRGWKAHSVPIGEPAATAAGLGRATPLGL